MKNIARTLFALFVLGASSQSQVAPAHAHSWYPKECCHDRDCAPVDRVAQVVPVDGHAPQLFVTSKHGKAVIPTNFPVRESKDGRMHVCMRHDEFGDLRVVCLFVPAYA